MNGCTLFVSSNSIMSCDADEGGSIPLPSHVACSCTVVARLLQANSAQSTINRFEGGLLGAVLQAKASREIYHTRTYTYTLSLLGGSDFQESRIRDR